MQSFELKSAKLGDLIQSTNVGTQVICMVVEIPSSGYSYVRLKVMSLSETDHWFPNVGTTFQQSPHNKLWKPL